MHPAPEAIMDYDHDEEADRRRRETFLTVLLSVLGGMGLLFWLVLITGGLLLYAAIGVAAVAALGLLNYLLWGYLFSRETEGEREEAEFRARMDLNDWDLPEPHRSRHD
jgi:Flp pilus assembly protein TadB